MKFIFRYIFSSIFVLLSGLSVVYAQKAVPISADFDEINLHESLWEYKSGDFDARFIDPMLWIDSIRDSFDGTAVLSLRVSVAPELVGKPISMHVSQRGASEIYLDDRLLVSYGKVSGFSEKEEKYNPFYDPFVFIFERAGEQVIRVNYSNTDAYELHDRFGRYARTAGFKINLQPAEKGIPAEMDRTRFRSAWQTAVAGITGALAMLHFFLFVFYPKKPTNLYYSLFLFSLSLTFFINYLQLKEHNDVWVIYFNIANYLVTLVRILFLIRLLYALFLDKTPRHFYALSVMMAASFALFFSNTFGNWHSTVFFTLAVVEIIRIIVVSVREKKMGSWRIMPFAVVFLLLGLLYMQAANTFGLAQFLPIHLNLFFSMTGTFGISAAMSVYLARDFAMTHNLLSEQLDKVRELSAKTIEQEQLNRRIVEEQNERLELKVAERTAEVQEVNMELAVQNEEILAQRDAIEAKGRELKQTFDQLTDSLKYAQRIQKALLGQKAEITAAFADGFIFFRPRDIVSGDFYRFAEISENHPAVTGEKALCEEFKVEAGMKLFIAGDCTGHGIPGAFMTVMGIDFIEEIIHRQGIVRPDLLLYALDEKLKGVFRKSNLSGDSIHDGMDLAVILVDVRRKFLYFGGAKNPMWLVRNDELIVYKGSRFPVGSDQYRKPKTYETERIEIQEKDAVYLFSDGFQDQFGGPKGGKYLRARFREFITGISHLPMSRQHDLISEEFEDWKKSSRRGQTDDVLVAGFRLL